ncbi:MAG: helicase-related protein [Alphaproteobacteria bacterium]
MQQSVLITSKGQTTALHEEFRNGSAQVPVSSWVGQHGLNIPEASTVIFYDRAWTHDGESQAIARVLRPSQKRDVQVVYLHLEGLIDEYKAQMVEWKAQAAHAGLDYGETIAGSEEFRHIDTILGRFRQDIEELEAA